MDIWLQKQILGSPERLSIIELHIQDDTYLIVLLILLIYQVNELQLQDPKNLLFHKNLQVDVHLVPTLMVEHAVVKMDVVGISVAL